ncbi:MAG: hypothetical protein ACOYWZ_09880 [Bacillota bacterium]
MDYIHKLPFILGASMSIIVGIVSYKSGIEPRTIYIRMSIGMVVFFAAGIYVRSILKKIDEEVKKKKDGEERLLREQQVTEESSESTGDRAHKIDYRVDEDSYDSALDLDDSKLYDEEFTPLSVNSVTVNKNEEL